MPPNVLLIVLDSVRAKNLGITGHHRSTTPFLSNFSDEAVIYEQARSAGSRSITGHASLFTGRNVEEHGLTTAERQLRSGSTIFEKLQNQGYSTGVFSENVWITNLDIGLSNGFGAIIGPQDIPFPSALNPRGFVASEGAGEYISFLRASLQHEQTAKSLLNGLATKLSSDYEWLLPFNASTPGSLYVDRFLDWQIEKSEPWAACINLMDAHGPYEPSPEHDIWGGKQLRSIQDRRPKNWELLTEDSSWWMLSAIESLYDGAIHQLDYQLRRIVDKLKQRDEFDDTLIVITSDHGEGFGEPSRVRSGIRVAGHNTSLHEVILHVPLIVKFPGQEHGRRNSRLASLTKFPTVVEKAIDGNWTTADFNVERAFASSFGILVDEQLRSRAERFQDLDTLRGFNERMRAVFTDDSERIQKEIAFGHQNAVRIRIRDAQTSYVVDEIDPSSVGEQFEGLSKDDLIKEASGIEAADESTKKRLEDLGYM